MLNFSILIPKDSKGEISMFTNFIEVDLRHLLRHPLCESFIYFKWLKIRKFFFASLMFQLLFTVLHSTFVLLIYSSSQCVIRNNCKFKVCYYCLTLLWYTATKYFRYLMITENQFDYLYNSQVNQNFSTFWPCFKHHK